MTLAPFRGNILPALRLFITVFFAVFTVAAAVNGSEHSLTHTAENTPPFASFRDIPGVTADEIAAVERLQKEKKSFVYGMLTGTESFINDNGEVAGYSARLTRYLSQLFGIPFQTKIYDWDDLIKALATQEVDFTGELSDTAERRKIYLMTDEAIATALVKYFCRRGTDDLREIAQYRPVRFAFLNGATTEKLILTYLENENLTSESRLVDDYASAYSLLKNGEIDAFVGKDSAEAAFVQDDEIVATTLFPLTYHTRAFATQNFDLAAVVTILNKALATDDFEVYLSREYEAGYADYLRHKFFVRLTPEEGEALRELRRQPVPVAVEPDNYPRTFYNEHEKQWQGIAVEVLDHISELTGLTFQRVNNEKIRWAELLAMLERGDAALVTELIKTPERAGRFLWTKLPYSVDHYVLISRRDDPRHNLTDILHAKVGAEKGTAYADFFRNRFPKHRNLIEYSNTSEMFADLKNGKIDLVMSANHVLFLLSHYREQADFKVDFAFTQPIESTFGFNLTQAPLREILDKALAAIDTKVIETQWLNRTFNYRNQAYRTERIRLIAGILAALVICGLLVVISRLHRNKSRVLEKLVQKRTRELQAQTETAQAASEAKSAFLANMSHEIRTPLNAIIGLSEIVLSSGKLAAAETEKLDKIYGSGVTLLDIVNNILDLSKVESGKMELVPVEYDVASLLNDTLSLISAYTGTQEIEFRLNFDKELPQKLFGDDLRIKQIFNNLLSNAFKYTKKGLVIWSVWTVRNEADDANVWLVSEVHDTGVGIRAEHLEKIFGTYSQVDTRNNRAVQGTGLGLAIAKKIAEQMDGTLTVQSEYGEGSVFSVRIKQRRVGEQVIGENVTDKLNNFEYLQHKRDARQKSVKLDLSYARVLVVDDVTTNLIVAEGLLSPYKCAVDCVNSGQKAIDAIRAETVHYDMILMDHMMPEMDGVEAAQRIRALGTLYAEKIPIIALTANAVSGMDKFFIDNGFNGFISKPIDLKLLEATLDRWARDKSREKTADTAV